MEESATPAHAADYSLKREIMRTVTIRKKRLTNEDKMKTKSKKTAIP